MHVVAPDLPTNSLIRQELEKMGAQVHEVFLRRTNINPLTDLMMFYYLWRLIYKIKPNFSFAYTIKPVIWGTIAAWLAGVPERFALITGVGYTFQEDNESRSWIRLIAISLYSIALRRAHKIFFQNSDDEALFHSLGIINPSDRKTVVVNGSGVDIKSFAEAPFPDVIQFLMIARFLGDKGIREYIQAASIVRHQYPQVHFALVGSYDESPDGISKNEVEHWIELGDVKILGRLENVKPAISESSVYVLPSYREGTPRSTLEAMSMGRPIITTDTPGCRETVIHGQNGFLVPVKSVDELVNAMIRFILSPGLINKMGSMSRQLALEKYDVNKVNDHILREMQIY